MARLECKGINKSYGAVVALRDVSISIERGEVRALFGGNGSGKSTLAKIIGGFVGTSGGKIYLDGKETTFSSPASARKKHVVITAQELSLLSNLSVAENLTICNMPTKMGAINRKELRESALAALNRLGLAKLIDKKIEELSINHKYMVEFAKALVQEPEILILDEITSALYREEVEIVRNVVRELSSKGCSVIFVSHRLPELYAICDSVTILRNGSVIGTYDISKMEKNELLSLMTGRNITEVEIAEDADGCYENRKVALSVSNLNLLGRDSTVSLELHEGETIGVAGLQGNGQSELVRMLFAMDRPVSLELYGKPCKLKSPRAAVKKKMAFISGERELEGTFANRSIMENVSAITDLVLHAGKSRESKLEILKKYNVVMDSPKQLIQNLSGGNQQKVVMARWTSAEPKIILADDPTKGIDVNARRDVHNLLKELTYSGSAVIFVSSDDEELVELTKSVPFSKVIVMYDGQIVGTLKGSDITTENIAAYAMPKEGGAENK